MHENAMDATTLRQYLADDPPTIVPLAIKPHFEALSKQEKKVGALRRSLQSAFWYAELTILWQYAHYISRAAWAGTRINLRQVSPESEGIYDFILALHKGCNGDWKKLQADAGVAEEDVKQFLNYSAQVLGNGGNFKSFGDSKFLPRTSAEKVAAIAKTTPAAEKIWEQIKGGVYESSSIGKMHLGYIDSGHISTYYPDSPTITQAEIEYVSDFLKDQGLMPENTRLRKTSSGDFELLIASAVTEPATRDVKQSQWTLECPVKGKKLTLVYGDHKVRNMAELHLSWLTKIG